MEAQHAIFFLQSSEARLHLLTVNVLCYVFGNVLELVKLLTWLDSGGQEGKRTMLLISSGFPLSVPSFFLYSLCKALLNALGAPTPLLS